MKSCWCVFSLLFASVIAQTSWNPVADPSAIVIQPSQDNSSAVRITVLTTSLIRIERSVTRGHDGNFTFLDLPTQGVVNRLLDVPDFHVSRPLDTLLELFTSDIQLVYDFSGNGSFNAASLSITVLSLGNTWQPGLDPINDGQSLLGTIRTLDFVSHGLARKVKPELLPYPQWLNCSFMNYAQTFNSDQCVKPGDNCSNFCQWGLIGRAGKNIHIIFLLFIVFIIKIFFFFILQ